MSKPLSKVTVKQILDKYKDVLGDAGTVNFVFKAFEKIYNKETAKLFRELVEEQIGEEILKSGNKKLIEEQLRIITIDMVQKSYEQAAKEADDVESLKRWIAAELYIQNESRLNEKQKQELERLVLNGDKIYLYKYKNKDNQQFLDCKVFSREPKEQLKESDYFDKSKEVFLCALDVLEAPELREILKEDYKKEVMDAIMTQYGREYLVEVKAINERGELKDENDLNVDELSDDNIDIFLKKVSRFLKENFEYVDKEKLLLNLAGKLILGLKVKKGEKIKSISVKSKGTKKEEEQAVKTSIQIIRLLEKELSNKIYEGKIHNILSTEEEVIATISLEEIRQFLNSCTEDKYLTEANKQDIHTNLEKGILPEDFRELEISKVNVDDFFKMIKTYNKETNDIELKEQLQKSIIEVLKYLIASKQITEKEILELGLSGEVDLEIVKEIDLEKIEPEKYDELLQNSYLEYIFSGGKKEEEEKLARVAKIYKFLQDKGYIKHSQDNLIERITSNYEEENMDEVIKDLYRFGLIDETKLVEWLAGDALIEIYKNDRYMPAQFKNYEENGLIGIKDIIKFINSLPDNNMKWFEIGSIYPGDNEKDIEKRKILYDGCMKIEKTAKGGAKGKNGNLNGGGSGQSGNAYITDPYARMQLITLIDPKAISRLTSDGHWIVELPSFDEVIIEKVLDENGDISYGNSTFIIPKKIYNFRKHIFMKDDKIIRAKIIEEIANGNGTKMEHFINTWGTKLKEHFNITLGETYDDKKIEEIDHAIERVKNSRKKREK